MSRVGQFVSFTAIVAGGMFTLGAMLLLLAKESGNKTAEGVVLVVSLVVATIAIGLGPGSVPYTLMGELFPAEYRTLGSCVVLVVRYHKIIQPAIVFFLKPLAEHDISVSIVMLFIDHNSSSADASPVIAICKR